MLRHDRNTLELLELYLNFKFFIISESRPLKCSICHLLRSFRLDLQWLVKSLAAKTSNSLYSCSSIYCDTYGGNALLYFLYSLKFSMVITSCLLQHYDIIVFNCKENLKRDWNREAVKGGQSPTELDPSHPVVKVRHILSEEFYRGGYIVTFLIPPKPILDPIISNDYVHEYQLHPQFTL